MMQGGGPYDASINCIFDGTVLLNGVEIGSIRNTASGTGTKSGTFIGLADDISFDITLDSSCCNMRYTGFTREGTTFTLNFEYVSSSISVTVTNQSTDFPISGDVEIGVYYDEACTNPVYVNDEAVVLTVNEETNWTATWTSYLVNSSTCTVGTYWFKIISLSDDYEATTNPISVSGYAESVDFYVNHLDAITAVSGTLAISGNLILNRNLYVNAKVTVSGDISGSGTLYASGTVSCSGTTSATVNASTTLYHQDFAVSSGTTTFTASTTANTDDVTISSGGISNSGNCTIYCAVIINASGQGIYNNGNTMTVASGGSVEITSSGNYGIYNYNYATFNLNEGAVIGITTTGAWNIYNHNTSTFTVNGALIIREGSTGGGIYSYNNSCNFRINGTLDINCSGTGIDQQGSSSSFNFNDGSVTNIINTGGNAIYAYASTINVNSGAVINIDTTGYVIYLQHNCTMTCNGTVNGTTTNSSVYQASSSISGSGHIYINGSTYK